MKWVSNIFMIEVLKELLDLHDDKMFDQNA